VQLKIDVRDKEVALVLRTLQGRMQDMTPVMREIGEIVRDSVMRNFREGRAPNRRPWRPSLRAILQRGQTLAFSSLLIGTTAETADEADTEPPDGKLSVPSSSGQLLKPGCRLVIYDRTGLSVPSSSGQLLKLGLLTISFTSATNFQFPPHRDNC